MSTSQFQIQEAAGAHYQQLAELLEMNHQSTRDILAPGTKYWLARETGGGTIGTIRIELGNDSILLRSLGVLMPWRRHGVGGALIHRALESARQTEFKKAYLFSRTAGKYWMRFGFYQVSVSEVVEALPEVPQVRHFLEAGTIWTDVAWRCDLTPKHA